MNKMNNKAKERPYEADEYDWKIRQTIPFSQEIYNQSISMIAHYGNTEGKLLDVGCGAGMFERLLREQFPSLSILGIDPGQDMLEQAYAKQVDNVIYQSGTILDREEEKEYDIITALMSHHFVEANDRGTVLSKVYKALKPNGIYIAFENVIPDDPYMKTKELDRWEAYQVAVGKSVAEAAVHKARCGVYYFPMTVEDHVTCMKHAGFTSVYVFWRSYMQMGIMGVK